MPERVPEKVGTYPTGQVNAFTSEKRWTEKISGSRGFAQLDSKWAGLAVVAVAFVVLAVVTWRKWPDVLVDFGLQLYLPWRICEGQVLYRDLHYLAGGPLSQYFNALLFKIFGVSFRTLIFANLAITAAMLVLIYRRFMAAADRWTATTICLGIVLVFAYNEYQVVGNYNYLAPYSHELFHGLVLSILAAAFLSDWVSKQQLRYVFAAGFCFGLVFLTKPEIFVALAAVAITAFALFYVSRGRRGFVAESAAVFLVAAVIPVLGFFLHFLSVEDWRASLYSTAFAWAPLWLTPVAQNHFYLWCTGLDTPVSHLREMAIHFFCVALLVALYARLFKRETGFGAKRTTQLVLMIPLLAAAAWFNWLNCGASLPLLSLAACLLLCRNYQNLSVEREMTFPLLWSVLGLVLLAKLGLFSRVWHYGFVLAMPAAITAIFLLFWLLPVLLEKKYDLDQRPFRLAVWLALVIGFGVLVHDSESWYTTKTLAVGQGGDRILAFDPRLNPGGAGVQLALEWIEKNVPRDGTLAVLPEGTTINYLSRRVNPTPCLDWTPTVLTAFGQAGMTAAFEKTPPDYIFLVERDTAEFGVGYFGHSPGYGVDLMQWIGKNYQPVYQIGQEPLRSGLFGIEILKRLPSR
ncbi:MAG TPA: glycosyltransferase family 39 protein [Candidatus Limnocylindrales bacterium]|nr:glycosyltransferase family 39 protein [Candidatus Limnocylindrales bacterium]